MMTDTTAPIAPIGALELDGDALRAAAMCADDVFDIPEERHVEQARRFVTAYLKAAGEGTPPPAMISKHLSQNSEFDWPPNI